MFLLDNFCPIITCENNASALCFECRIHSSCRLFKSVIKASGLNVLVDAVRSGGGPLAPTSTSGCGHEGRHAVEFLHSPPDQGAKVNG